MRPKTAGSCEFAYQPFRWAPIPAELSARCQTRCTYFGRGIEGCIVSRVNAAAERWAQGLEEWAIPQAILDQAPQVPFVFPPEMFAAPPADHVSESRSTQLAAEVVANGGSLLDIGCGGGAAAFAVAPPATHLVGTDRQKGMCELFARTAEDRGISCET